MVLVHDRQRGRDLTRVLHGGLVALRTMVPPAPGLRLCLLAQDSPGPDADCPGSALYWRDAEGQAFVILRLYLRAGARPCSTDELLATLADLYLEAVSVLVGQPVVLAAQNAVGARIDEPLLRQPGDEHHRLRRAA